MGSDAKWWISAIASCARRFGRNPYEHGLKSASKIGSSTSFRLAWTTRSVMVGIPSLRSFPLFFGISTRRTSTGPNSPDFSESRIGPRKAATPPQVSIWPAVALSTPGVPSPLFLATLSHARGSPAPGVLRRRCPTRAFGRRRAYPRPGPLGREAARGTHAGGSHVHCHPINGLGTRLYPCGIATATPQTFTVASRPRRNRPSLKFPCPWQQAGYAPRTSPNPPGLELAYAQEA